MRNFDMYDVLQLCKHYENGRSLINSDDCRTICEKLKDWPHFRKIIFDQR